MRVRIDRRLRKCGLSEMTVAILRLHFSEDTLLAYVRVFERELKRGVPYVGQMQSESEA